MIIPFIYLGSAHFAEYCLVYQKTERVGATKSKVGNRQSIRQWIPFPNDTEANYHKSDEDELFLIITAST